MKIGLVQYSQIWEDPEKNIEKLNSLLQKDKRTEDLLIFPEMTLTGFTMQSEKFAEEIDGIGTRYFMDLAAKLRKHILAGIIERDGDKVYNSLVHFDNKGLITARYRKIHLFSLAEEEKNYTPGKEKIITKIGETRTGLSICYDLRFPELYRYYAKQGTDFIVDIASWPVKRIEHWKALLKARAIENQCYVAGVNRVGEDAYHQYNGSSIVYNPMGEIIAFSENNEKIIQAELDFDYLEKVRKGFGFLNDITLI